MKCKIVTCPKCGKKTFDKDIYTINNKKVCKFCSDKIQRPKEYDIKINKIISKIKEKQYDNQRINRLIHALLSKYPNINLQLYTKEFLMIYLPIFQRTGVTNQILSDIEIIENFRLNKIDTSNYNIKISQLDYLLQYSYISFYLSEQKIFESKTYSISKALSIIFNEFYKKAQSKKISASNKKLLERTLMEIEYAANISNKKTKRLSSLENKYLSTHNDNNDDEDVQRYVMDENEIVNELEEQERNDYSQHMLNVDDTLAIDAFDFNDPDDYYRNDDYDNETLWHDKDDIYDDGWRR